MRPRASRPPSAWRPLHRGLTAHPSASHLQEAAEAEQKAADALAEAAPDEGEAKMTAEMAAEMTAEAAAKAASAAAFEELDPDDEHIDASKFKLPTNVPKLTKVRSSADQRVRTARSLTASLAAARVSPADSPADASDSTRQVVAHAADESKAQAAEIAGLRQEEQELKKRPLSETPAPDGPRTPSTPPPSTPPHDADLAYAVATAVNKAAVAVRLWHAKQRSGQYSQIRLYQDIERHVQNRIAAYTTPLPPPVDGW